MENKIKRRMLALILILCFVAWSVLIYNYSPDEITEAVGVKNGYILAFIIAFLGGTSILFPIPYYLVVFTLGAGGLNPFILGAFAGIGLMAGDSTSYLLGYHGGDILPIKLRKLFMKTTNWCLRCSYKLIFFVFLLYGSIIPIPNDLITVPMGLGKYPYWKVVIPLGIGNIIFNILVALAGFYGWGSFF
ncbi:MAG: VTT domain-containing protein [Nanoarchaeota archaeon]|nr:VTT domain-containing protein [Nanoarchaeota archaeon]